MSRSGLTTRDRARRGRGATPSRRPGRPAPNARSRPARRRRPLSRGRRRALRLALAVGAVAVVAWLLLASPVLAVRHVRVDGAVTLTADEVRRAAGVADGTPLLRVDVDAARTRVARLPQVASVQVTRGWPGTVVVTLTERLPVAVVDRGGTRSLVDKDGVLFDTITGDPPHGVVPLDVANPRSDDPTTRAALAALAAMPPDLRAQIARASATTDQDVTLTLAGGTTVLWGDAADSAKKASVLGALVGQIKAGTLDPAKTIDVSAPSAVVLR